jgi:hypothetical protein
MTDPTPDEARQIDALLGRITEAFGTSELGDTADWEAHPNGVAIRSGRRFYQLQGDDLIRMDSSDPRGPRFTIAHPDGTLEHNEGVVRRD